MDNEKITRLGAKGWKIGEVHELLGLSAEEVEYIEIKLALSKQIRELRRQKKISQKQLARRLGSSQSRVSKIEHGDDSVSLDLQIKSLLVLGATRRDLCDAISG